MMADFLYLLLFYYRVEGHAIKAVRVCACLYVCFNAQTSRLKFLMEQLKKQQKLKTLSKGGNKMA